jgi:hypothetical protein
MDELNKSNAQVFASRISDTERIRAEFYASTGYVPSSHAVTELLSMHIEERILAAWADYSSKRPPYKMADTVKQFFEGRDAWVVIDAMRLGLPMVQPQSGLEWRRNPKVQEAIGWLQTVLRDGPIPSKRLFRDALDSASIKADMLRTAGRSLGIKPKLRRGAWSWELPTTESTGEAHDFEIAEPEVSVDVVSPSSEVVPTVPAAPTPVADSKSEKIIINASASEEEQAEAIRRILGGKS